MKISKTDIGKKVYYIDSVFGTELYVIEFGMIEGIVPKYGYQDNFSQHYAREESIVIYQQDFQSSRKIVVNNPDLIFNNIGEAIEYLKTSRIVFGFSVINELRKTI